jgi:hypothetical protein
MEFGIVCVLFYIALIVVVIAGLWKTFEKAGQPGWAAIVPIYNVYVLTCEIAKKEILWFILMFIPFVGIVASIMVSLEVARKFNKSDGFGIGLAFLPFIFYPMLGFGDAQYGGRRRSNDYYDDDEEDEEPRPRKKKSRDYDDE